MKQNGSLPVVYVEVVLMSQIIAEIDACHDSQKLVLTVSLQSYI